MTDGIEIYVRDSGDQTLLNFYIPERLREEFITALRSGSYLGSQVPIALELSTLPKWIVDKEQRTHAERRNESVHVRIPVTAINVQSTE
ncbi:hypothetical protein [Ralstonia insidiosa]|uniref:Uncharacterized protein n=1 Tax=Ralstonia insidiosa TaxID=190721 RepID=A0A848P2H6_9RALS|nr:hypothetical protein [Ralstonia insidiosa]NMV41941.1 hypothetical protein [Ralstonia insidiosa]